MELQTFHLEAVLDFAVVIALPEAKLSVKVPGASVCTRHFFLLALRV